MPKKKKTFKKITCPPVTISCFVTRCVTVVVSSEKVVQKLSVACDTEEMQRNLLRVMREHVMTQYKHYQLYTHHVVTVMKCMSRVM